VLRALLAVSDAAPRVRRTDVFVAEALRLAAFRFLVAAPRFAAAWRWVGVWVAIVISSPRVGGRFDSVPAVSPLPDPQSRSNPRV